MCAVQAAELPQATPESVGFSSQRLALLDPAMHAFVDDGALAGIVALVTRHGKVVYFDAYGKRDIASDAPMRPDTIFRIYSMTKPVTAVAMMKLYELGKWYPDDPLSKYIPEFADLRVFAGVDDKGEMILEAPNHAPTVGELLTHTAGFTYGFGSTPVDELYRQKNPLGAANLQELIERLAAIPLLYQPGERWEYSVSVDVQGYLVEKLSGRSLPDFMREQIFEPLGMTDTGFAVPQAKLERLATIYAPAPGGGGLAPQPRDPNVTEVPGLASGGGGLYSTARDYARFAQMLANGGELDGARILAPSTVDLMRANHLPAKLMDGRFGIGFQRMRPGFGYGYDVAVYTDPHAAGSSTGEGTYLWDGAAGTWFWIDPMNDIVFVGMIQRMVTGGGMPNLQNLSRQLVQQALVEP
ncbi:MAG TPA: serine hydrolase domain-containing protein [Gammaproteobacteria bacterium]|nr:serine hydrolase domain-containing protein [Gammaproteobacteria bacterium]